MKLLRILLVVLGFLFLIGGIGGAVLSPEISGYECMSAEQIGKSADISAKAAEAAQGTAQQAELAAKAKEDQETAKRWKESCSKLQSTANIVFYVAIAVTVLGGLMIVSGFTRRTKIPS